MTKILETIANIIVGEEHEKYNLCELHVEFVKEKQEIFSHLERCKMSKGIVGIYSSRLGRGMFLCTVQTIYKLEMDTLIDVKPLNLDKGFLKSETVSLKDIQCICPFNQVAG